MSNIPVIQVGTGNETKVITPALLTAIGPNGLPVAIKADANGQILTSGGGAGAPSQYDFSVYLSSLLPLVGDNQVVFTLPYTISGRYEVRGVIMITANTGGLVTYNPGKTITEASGNMLYYGDGVSSTLNLDIFKPGGQVDAMSADGSYYPWTFQGSAKFTNYSSFTISTGLLGLIYFRPGTYICFKYLGSA